MRVLSVVQSLDLKQGGPPEVIRNQISVINKRKKIISILILKRLKLLYLIGCIFFPSKRIKIYRFLKKYDIIHFHELWSFKVYLITYFASKILSKHFFVGHGYLDPWSINEKLIKKKLFIKLFLQYSYNSACASFFSTRGEYFDASKNLKCHDIFIIPNGVDLEVFKKFEKKIELHKKKKIIFFGRIHKKKGIEIILNVIKKLPDIFFDKFYFEITGPGESHYVEKIKKIINLYDPKGTKVKMLDPILKKDKIQYLKTASIFILPSFEEGDSIALKESLATNLPVLISKQCRMDIVEKYNAGIILDTNEDSVYKALLKLTNIDIEEMGNNARKLIEDFYDNKECSRRLLNIYEDIYTGSHNSLDWFIKNGQ